MNSATSSANGCCFHSEPRPAPTTRSGSCPRTPPGTTPKPTTRPFGRLSAPSSEPRTSRQTSALATWPHYLAARGAWAYAPPLAQHQLPTGRHGLTLCSCSALEPPMSPRQPALNWSAQTVRQSLVSKQHAPPTNFSNKRAPQTFRPGPNPTKGPDQYHFHPTASTRWTSSAVGNATLALFLKPTS
jgi:hypothetical protein